MRVAVVVEPAPRRAAGGGQVEELCRALRGRGHDVTIFERRADPDSPARELLPHGVPVVRVAAGPPDAVSPDERLRLAPRVGYGLCAHWAGRPPDVVHAHGWRSGLAALTAVRELPQGARPAVVQTFYGLVAARTRVPAAPVARGTDLGIRARLEAAIARGVDSVAALCDEDVERLVTLGLDRRAVSVVPSGVDTDAFTPARHPAADHRPVRVLAVDRLAPAGRLDLAVRALAAVPGAELAVLTGSSLHPGHARRVYDLARRYRVADRVQLLEPPPADALPSVLRSADVLLRTRAEEPTGRLVLQAMACGVPVIGPAVGCLADAVVEGATGILVPPGDARALGAALAALVGDPLRREGYGLAAVERVRTRYAWPRIAAETERAYAAALRRSANGAEATRPGTAGARVVPTSP